MSHADELCAAAVTRNASILAVGIDLERDAALDAELEEIVCTPAERDWLGRQEPGQRGRLAMLCFSAKEAFYKCQYGLTKKSQEFADLELEVDLRDGTFRVARADALLMPICRSTVFSGRFGHAAGHLVTVAVLESEVA